MFEQGSKTAVMESPRWTLVFTGNLVALLAILVVGYPLTPSTIRAIVLSWILVVFGLTGMILKSHKEKNRE